jgi:hypothetical protein
MAHLLMTISDTALAVGNSENTVTGTRPSFLTHHSTSLQTPLKSHCQDPFRPTVWRDLTSVVRRPQHWQLASLTVLSKTTKMPLHFRQRTTMEKSLRELLPKGLASHPTSLLKGWVYATEEVGTEVKAEVTDPSKYLMPDAPLTHSQLKSASQLDDPLRRHRWASSITEALPSSLSVSKRTAVRHWLVTSGHTSMPQIHL